MYLKKPLINLMGENDDWMEFSLLPSNWKLVEAGVELLKHFHDIVKVWEAEEEPTMHRVIEHVYTLYYGRDDI